MYGHETILAWYDCNLALRVFLYAPCLETGTSTVGYFSRSSTFSSLSLEFYPLDSLVVYRPNRLCCWSLKDYIQRVRLIWDVVSFRVNILITNVSVSLVPNNTKTSKPVMNPNPIRTRKSPSSTWNTITPCKLTVFMVAGVRPGRLVAWRFPTTSFVAVRYWRD